MGSGAKAPPLSWGPPGLSTALSVQHEGAAQIEEMNSVFYPEKLRAARAAAKAARDTRQPGEKALVDLWREASKPRKDSKPSEAIPLQPAGCKLDAPHLFDQWLASRGLTDTLQRMEDRQGWAVFKYMKEPIISPAPHWETAYHGTWWYAVWLVLESGVFLESNDLSLGHDFWEPGVYCSPDVDTGLWYARPQILFGDGVYHRVIFELRVDPAQRKRNRKRGGVQWVFPCTGVALHAVLVRSNAPPAKGEERVNGWDPQLEAVPLGKSRPPPTFNLRRSAWPPHYDQWPFDLGNTSCPPWLRTSTTTKTPQAAPLPPSITVQLNQFGTHRFGGLYGHWLKEVKIDDGNAAPAAPAGSDQKSVSAGIPPAWRPVLPNGAIQPAVHPVPSTGGRPAWRSLADDQMPPAKMLRPSSPAQEGAAKEADGWWAPAVSPFWQAASASAAWRASSQPGAWQGMPMGVGA